MRAAGHAQVAERFVVDREEAGRRAVFGRHVGDRGAVGEREFARAGAEELDKAADHPVAAQHLGDAEDEIGRGRARSAVGPMSLTPTTSGMSW